MGGNKHHLETAVELDENGNVTEAYLIRYWGAFIKMKSVIKYIFVKVWSGVQ